MEKISFNAKCTSCNHLIKFQLESNLFGQTVNVRCNRCSHVLEYKVPTQQQLEDYKKRQSNQEQSSQPTKTEGNQTVIGDLSDKNKSFKYFIEIQKDENTNYQQFELDQNFYSIGRYTSIEKHLLPDIAIITEDLYMSKKHAALKKHSNGKYSICDTKSTNKVFVNNNKLEDSDEFYLNNGDIIKLGRTIITFKAKEENRNDTTGIS
jgi:pSer/pThr/pTyr-binding forkhead associated (FHA) protein